MISPCTIISLSEYCSPLTPPNGPMIHTNINYLFSFFNNKLYLVLFLLYNILDINLFVHKRRQVHAFNAFTP